MSNKNVIDDFVEQSKKNRQIKISDDELAQINDILEESNIEETQLDDSIPLVAKPNEKFSESQL